MLKGRVFSSDPKESKKSRPPTLICFGSLTIPYAPKRPISFDSLFDVTFKNNPSC